MKIKKSKNKGKIFENKVSKTIASGSLWFNKGDLHYKDYVIECKYTDKKSFRITANLLEKLWEESLTINKEPLLVIGIKRNDKEMFVLNCLVKIERR